MQRKYFDVSSFKYVFFQMAVILFSSILFSFFFKHDLTDLSGIQANVFTKIVLVYYSVLGFLCLFFVPFSLDISDPGPLHFCLTVFSSSSSSCRYVLHVKLKFY